MNTHESYVSLETANMLKEAGFDWVTKHAMDMNGQVFTFDGYGRNWNTPDQTHCLSAPTLDIAARWLREARAITIDSKSTVVETFGFECHYISQAKAQADGANGEWIANSSCMFYSYEEALEEGLKSCLRYLINLKNETN